MLSMNSSSSYVPARGRLQKQLHNECTDQYHSHFEAFWLVWLHSHELLRPCALKLFLHKSVTEPQGQLKLSCREEMRGAQLE